MARTLHAPHLSTDPTPLATGLYLGLCLLVLALMASAADLLAGQPRPYALLRAPAHRAPLVSPRPVDARDAERAPVRPARPRLQPRSHATPASDLSAPPGERGGMLAALRALAAEGRLPSPADVEAPAPGSAVPREALADAGPLALPGESDGIDARRDGEGATAQRLELVTAGARAVSYGPKPTPTVDLDPADADLAALAPSGGAVTAPKLVSG